MKNSIKANVFAVINIIVLWLFFFAISKQMTWQQASAAGVLLGAVSLAVACLPVLSYLLKRERHHCEQASRYADDGIIEHAEAHDSDANRYGKSFFVVMLPMGILLIGIVLLYFLFRPF